MQRKNLLQNQESGIVIIMIMMATIVVGGILFAGLSLATGSLYRSKARIMLLQAQYAAESGVDAAISNLNNVSDAYTGAASEVSVLNNGKYKATFTSTVASVNANDRSVTAIGRVYIPATTHTATYTRTIRVDVKRSSTETTAALTARNIFYVASGVKNLTAKDVYANGFIQMNKNTTNLIAENITVADRNTGASNCSIGGAGNLLKPTTFTTPGQTTTNITTAYNNCISPPGNSSNSNFTVAANQPNVEKLASTYIPWSQYMSNTQNGNCSDLSANLINLFGPQTHNIPASGAKDTHYPDSGSNVSIACGLLGDVYLNNDRYNITQNIHIRGSLCVVQILGCSPTFYNPNPNVIRWVFVEGAIDFNSVTTVPGSGPIVFVSYGADPLTQILNCPYGGSIYIGSSGTTSAPEAYFIATNGICVNGTKFSSNPALGGLSGKNLYIASNPGTPFDLSINTSFPDIQIPVNLSWRAVRYQRL